MDVKKFNSVEDAIKQCPDNQTIIDNMVKAWTYINDDKYKKIICSVSGGSDSDVMIDICWRCDINNKIEYAWYDTGIEYIATKNHLKFLEEKYGIKINTHKAIKSIPLSCREYGQPFLSKRVSEYVQRLQHHGFKWEDEDFNTLYQRYPKCKSALEWWCNERQCDAFNISHNKWLKEFMIANPPKFNISNQCCNYAKKKVAHETIKKNKYDLNIVGIRKAEGGMRSTSHKDCFDNNDNGCDNYRPLFWYLDKDKQVYEEHFGVTHSNCYSEYGLKRTGCAGCPYGRDFEQELQVIQEHEPKLLVAVNNIFGKAYEYTRQYRDFYKEKNKCKENMNK
jgi:3'-phosphoadenosine 5'-phosphosulfate sulfotransferase (PAPS reductase)/FAD synthetase